MAIARFQHDDAGYLAWRTEHLRNGYVLNLDATTPVLAWSAKIYVDELPTNDSARSANPRSVL